MDQRESTNYFEQYLEHLFLINFEILIETNFHCPRPAISGICKRIDKSAGSS